MRGRRVAPGQMQLGFMEEPAPLDPWVVWAARPHTPQARYDDAMLQLKRDTAVLNGDPVYCTDRAFYEWRIEAMREQASSAMQEILIATE